MDLTACVTVTDVGVSSLAARKSLQSLSLELTNVTDVAIQAVARALPNLRCLNLGACRNLSNVGVQIVASHGARLARLSLAGCPSLLDFDVADLAKSCLGLQELSLRSCRRITNDAARQIGLLLVRVSLCCVFARRRVLRWSCVFHSVSPPQLASHIASLLTKLNNPLLATAPSLLLLSETAE